MAVSQSDEILDAAERLPSGATLIVAGLDWDDYERVLEGLADRRRLRLSFDCGKLEIVSPTHGHEKYSRFVDAVVMIFSDAFGLEVEASGSTTWKKRAKNKGLEADGCYYVREARRVIGKDRIDLDVDPPPDIAVEIDLTGTFLNKFLIYAALRVPELWLYDGRDAHIHELDGAGYSEIPESRFLPGMTDGLLTEFLDTCKTLGFTKARHAVRRRVQSIKRQMQSMLR